MTTTELSKNEMEKYFFRASADDFKKVQGQPIGYWLSKKTLLAFDSKKYISDVAEPRQGLATSDNNRFLRNWFEVAQSRVSYSSSNREEALDSKAKWFPYNKGGSYRKWFGNNDYFVNWHNDGEELLSFAKSLYGSPTRTIKNISYYFRQSITWSALSSGSISLRFNPKGFIFDTKGQCIYAEDRLTLYILMAYLNSKPALEFLKVLAPTLDFNSGVIAKLPYEASFNFSEHLVKNLLEIAKVDWNSYETSWDFTTLPLLAPEHRQATLAATYKKLRQHWQATTLEMQRLEEENNRIFIDAYGLQDELTPDVPLDEITLTCNPHYRYRLGKAWEDKPAEKRSKELEKRLLKDTMAEFISYAVGCMFGRYSLDKEGLILANQGEDLTDFLKQVSNPSFEVDTNNVLPILDADWFTDDIVERFRKFLQLTFGKEHFTDNLKFIEKGLGKNIRTYFLRDFYTDHLQRYKKRPIYWQFSSPKGSFNALIYMHRYRPDTVSLVLNDYLREYRTKLEAQVKFQQSIEVNAAASARDKTQALKEIDRLNKVLLELNDYENDTLYPLATQQVSLDLDDGVKVNYPKLGNALKKVAGLSK